MKHVEKTSIHPKIANGPKKQKYVSIPHQSLKSSGAQLLLLHIGPDTPHTPSVTRMEPLVLWPDAPASFPAVPCIFLPHNKEGGSGAWSAGGKNLTSKKAEWVVLFLTMTFSYRNTRSCWKSIWTLYRFPIRDPKITNEEKQSACQWRRGSGARTGNFLKMGRMPRFRLTTWSCTLLILWYVSHLAAIVRRPSGGRRAQVLRAAAALPRCGGSWGRRCGCGDTSFTRPRWTLGASDDLSELLAPPL